jgi:hypothetical protein
MKIFILLALPIFVLGLVGFLISSYFEAVKMLNSIFFISSSSSKISRSGDDLDEDYYDDDFDSP